MLVLYAYALKFSQVDTSSVPIADEDVVERFERLEAEKREKLKALSEEIVGEQAKVYTFKPVVSNHKSKHLVAGYGDFLTEQRMRQTKTNAKIEEMRRKKEEEILATLTSSKVNA